MTTGIRVLHVDDDPSFVDLVATFLERESDRLEVHTATDAEAADEVLSTTEIDCVVSDYEMPGRDGIEFLEALREKHPDLPFILFTGKGSEEIASEAISAGVTDYLQKEGGTDQYAILANRVINAVERVRAKRQRRRQLDAIETAKEGIAILDADGYYVYVNEAYADFYRYDPEDILGEHWSLLYPDEEVPWVFEEIIPVLEERGHWSGTTTGLRADGTTFVEDHTLATTADGEIICTIRDATDREARERRIRSLHEATRQLMTAETPEEVATITAQAARDTLNYPWNVVRLRGPEDRLVPVAVTREMHSEMGGDRPTYEIGQPPVGAAFERGETWLTDDVDQFDDDVDRGNVRAAMYVPIGNHGVVTVADPDSEALGQSDVELAEILAANAEAALDRVEQAQELKQRNEQLTRFASTLAHDLRNPLSVVTGNVSLVAREYDDDRLAAAEDALERVEEIVDDTLSLARSGETIGSTERVDLADLVVDCRRSSDLSTVDLHVADPPTLIADPSRTRQLLENLFRNAVEHATSDDQGPTVRVGGLTGGFYVEDDGPGISEADRETVFEVGYSTRDDGTGLGLAIVKRIADAHGWEIDVTESDAGGARFEITGVDTVES